MIYGECVAYLLPISGAIGTSGIPGNFADDHIENITHAALTGRTASAFKASPSPQTGRFFMHFLASDDAVKLAKGLRAALDKTNSVK